MATKNWGFRTLTGGGAGSLDSILVAGITNLDQAFGMVNGLYHPYTYDSSSAASESSPYVIIPNDNVSGTGAWVLGGFQGAMSHVFATTGSTQNMVDNTSTPVIFGTKVHDDLVEYTVGTGIFKAKYAGDYSISSNLRLASAAWSQGKLGLLTIVRSVGDNINGPFFNSQAADTLVAGFGVSCVDVRLAVDEEVTIDCFQNSGGDIALQAQAASNWLAISRIA